MPRVSLYVTTADKAFLDALPAGRTGAAILREALRRSRQAAEECGHPIEHLELVCRRCGEMLDTHLMHTPGDDGEESPGQEDAHPVCI